MGAVVLARGVAVLGVCVVGCASASPADPRAVEREQTRLLAPFRTERTVAAEELRVTMTANFFNEFVPPAVVQGMHESRRDVSADGSTSYVYASKIADARPMQVALADTRFAIIKRVVVTVLGGRQDLTLEADASGFVVVQTGDERFHSSSVRIADGLFQRQ